MYILKYYIVILVFYFHGFYSDRQCVANMVKIFQIQRKVDFSSLFFNTNN